MFEYEVVFFCFYLIILCIIFYYNIFKFFCNELLICINLVLMVSRFLENFKELKLIKR